MVRVVALYPTAHPEAPAPRDVNTGPQGGEAERDADAVPAGKS
jgi:hypothetical protein